MRIRNPGNYHTVPEANDFLNDVDTCKSGHQHSTIFVTSYLVVCPSRQNYQVTDGPLTARPKKLQLVYPGNAMAGNLVGLVAQPMTASLHLLCWPALSHKNKKYMKTEKCQKKYIYYRFRLDKTSFFIFKTRYSYQK
jgi:hypothetical protein